MKVRRTDEELDRALVDRLYNLKDYVEEYRSGKRGRIKDIATNLRVLVVKTRTNRPLLFDVAKKYDVPLIVNRDVPPIRGLKSRLNLDEALEELCFASAVPSAAELTGIELIKEYADQEGAHDDMSISETFNRSKGDGLLIGGVPPHDRTIIGLANQTLQAAQPLVRKLSSDLT